MKIFSFALWLIAAEMVSALGLGPSDCGGQALSCVNCSSTLSCTKIGNLFRPIQVDNCPAEAPYCSNGACVSTPADLSCVLPPPASFDFKCSGDGYFPDPSSCRRYWLCVGGSAFRYDCAAEAVYSHARADCVFSTDVPCSTAACDGPSYQPYAQSLEIYFYCKDAVNANAEVAACPPNHVVDSTGHCVLTCTSAGRLPVESNGTMYYECSKTFSKPFLRACPSGSTFNVEKQRCVTGREESQKGYDEDYYAPDPNIPESEYDLPVTLKVGSATSAFQVEGAWNDSDKSLSIMDVYYHSRPSLENGDIADDSFHKYMDDVAALDELQMDFYRFSFSWPRLLPTGDKSAPSINGTQYYKNLIKALTDKGIEPVVTLYHWDLPEVLQVDGGWLNPAIQDRFVEYATYCFETFGDQVKSWLMVNEPLTQCLYGYELGYLGPAVQMLGTGGYQCNHNMVLAHAKAYRVYQERFKYQGGKISSAINMAFAQPKTASKADVDAAQRYMEWQYAWYADPFFFGDYPASMRQTIDALSSAENRSDSRLPRFTAEEKKIVMGAMDYLGVNNYGAIVASASTATRSGTPNYSSDLLVNTENGKDWTISGSPRFPVTPWSLAGCVKWVKDRYNNFPMWVTENGYCGTKDDGLNDSKRIGYYSGYMRGLMRAINKDGANIIGYTAWSLLDNLEWNDGFSLKFGLVHVDFEDPERPRTIKDSGRFIKQIITNRNVPYVKVT
ncbi:myrosinase 1 [Frankliniella occidentalis]|uniref:Myrosinase 1 n=1 Tax=Frankliniella occidentalis TaxID=133901 RepID=A0A9C6XTF1_FRAOC|nr:myrosinase 1 [Frankliniella occidentalis]